MNSHSTFEEFRRSFITNLIAIFEEEKLTKEEKVGYFENVVPILDNVKILNSMQILEHRLEDLKSRQHLNPKLRNQEKGKQDEIEEAEEPEEDDSTKDLEVLQQKLKHNINFYLEKLGNTKSLIQEQTNFKALMQKIFELLEIEEKSNQKYIESITEMLCEYLKTNTIWYNHILETQYKNILELHTKETEKRLELLKIRNDELIESMFNNDGTERDFKLSSREKALFS